MNKFETSINVFSFTSIPMRDRLSRRRDIELWQFLVCRPHHCLVFCLFCVRAWSWIWHAWSMALKVFIVWLLDSTRLTTGFLTISFTCWIYNLVLGDCQLILLACWAGFNHAYSPSLSLSLSLYHSVSLLSSLPLFWPPWSTPKTENTFYVTSFYNPQEFCMPNWNFFCVFVFVSRVCLQL